MIYTHKKYMPQFGVSPFIRDQWPVCILTVLSVNEKVGDCAAYRGVTLDLSKAGDAERDGVYEQVRAGGDKIGEDEARRLFPQIEESKLRYRR